MKILLVSSSSGSRGGGELYLKSLASGLACLGHGVTTLMSTHPQMDELARGFQAEQLPVRRIDYTNTYHRRLRAAGAALDQRSVRRLSHALQIDAPDVVHLNLQNVEDGLDLIQAANISDLPHVATVHITRAMAELGAAAGWLRDRFARRTYVRCNPPCIGISPTSAADLASYLTGRRDVIRPDVPCTGCNERVGTHVNGHPAMRIYSVPNGVVRPQLADRQPLRAQWGIDDQAVVMGVVARIEQQKNPLFLCRALAELPRHVHVVWVGDGRLRPQLEQEIQRCGLEDRFHLDGWRDDATARMAGFDLFVLPSLYEGLPLALLEAMAAGLPCIVSDVDGTRDAIQHQASGYLCPVNDAPAWQAALRPLIESPELRVQIGAAARQRHQAEFSLEAMARRTLAVYEDVIERFASCE